MSSLIILSPNVTPKRATEIIDSLYASYKAQFKRNPSVDMVISAQSGAPAAQLPIGTDYNNGGNSTGVQRKSNGTSVAAHSPMVYSVVIRLPDGHTAAQENDAEWFLEEASKS